MSNRIPFIPQQSSQFKPMKYYFCESDTSASQLSRSTFLSFLEQQPCPKGQIYIDFCDGVTYLFPFEPERAERFAIAYKEFETEYKRFYREQKNIRAGQQQTVLSFDQSEGDEESESSMQSAWLVSEDTPEDNYFAQERINLHSASFDALSDSDREILTGFLEAGCNARELARRLGKDPSGVLKLVKRAAERLKKEIEKNF